VTLHTYTTLRYWWQNKFTMDELCCIR